MMNSSDMDLVREYAQNRSEEAFATLVTRHVNLVYSVALRRVGEVQLAEEITQTVFIILARKAKSLNTKTVVAGWLCRTAHFVAAKALTLRRRRQNREQEAHMQSAMNENEPDAWLHIKPLLDVALRQLGEKDQDALVLRFFEGRNFKEVSAALGTSEAGAKMRVNRALEKLRIYFNHRGITLSAAAIAAGMAAHSVHAAPGGLAATVTVSAVKGTAVTASTLTLITKTLKAMAWTKLRTTAVAGIIAILTIGTATVAWHGHRTSRAASLTAPANYATPEAAVASLIQAAARGDLAGLSAGVTPEEMQRFRDSMAGKSDDEIRAGLKSWAGGMADYKITQTDVIDDDEVYVHIHATPSAEALHSGKAVIIMKKIGNEWKRAGDATE
jgi:RNA polymerase sigma factor (sigma-70 family)